MRKNQFHRPVLVALALFPFLCSQQLAFGTEKENAKENAIETPFVLVYERPLDSVNFFSQIGYVMNDLQYLVFDHLFRTNPLTGDIEPGLAESWQIAKDGKSILLTLRPNTRFTDGSPVRAEDVKFSLESHLDPKFRSMYSTAFRQIQRVEILNSSQLRVHYSEKIAYLLQDLAWPPILPEHFYGKLQNEGRWSKEMLGSGPYKLRQVEVGKKVELERNRDWWGYKAKLEPAPYQFSRIQFRFIKDILVATELLKRGEVHFVRYFEPADFLVYAEAPGGFGKHAVAVKTQDTLLLGSRFLLLNLKNPLFSDSRVRQALQHLFDRSEVNQKVFRGMLKPAVSYWHQNNSAADPKVQPLPYDPPKALALLKAAGWSDSDGDGILDKAINPGEAPSAFRFTILSRSPRAEKLLTLFKEAARRLGIDVTIRPLEAQAVFRMLKDMKYEAAYSTYAWSPPLQFAPSSLQKRYSTGPDPLNPTGYYHPEVEQVLSKAEPEMNRTTRERWLRRAYAILATDLPVLPWFDDAFLMYGASTRLERPRDAFAYTIGWEYWRWRP